MSKKRFHLLIILLALTLAMLACSLFGGSGDDVAENVAQPEVSAPDEVAPPAPEAEEPEKPEEQPGEQPPPPDSPPPSANLGEEYSSAEGGFSFRPIPDWGMEEDLGIATLEAPNATLEYGPFIMIVGGANDEEKTTVVPAKVRDLFLSNHCRTRYYGRRCPGKTARYRWHSRWGTGRRQCCRGGSQPHPAIYHDGICQA